MATTTNSRFLSIASREQDINTGWSIHVLDYKDMTSLVAIITEFSEFSFTQELNGVGTGSITMDEDSPFWVQLLENKSSTRLLLDREYVFEAWDRNTPRFAWLGQTVTNTVIGEDATRSVQISGPGIAQVLTWAKVWRPGWPTTVPIIKYINSTAQPGKKIPVWRETSYNDSLSAFQWGFPTNYPTMRMWYTVFQAAQRRGLIKFVKPMFTATTDSAKKPWQLIKTIQNVTGELYQPADRDQTLLDFLNNCTGQDFTAWFGQRLEWIMYPGFKLDVRTTIGTDRSQSVRYFHGNVISKERTRDREAIYNRVCAQDVDGDETNVTDSASVKEWNLREQWNTTTKEVTDVGLRSQIANRLVQQSKDEKDQWTLKVAYDTPDRVPFRNFFVGDKIGVNADFAGMGLVVVGDPVPYRVMAITINMTAENLIPECELTLQSMLDSKQNELQKQITKLINYPQSWNLGDLKNVNTAPATDGSSGGSNSLVYDPDNRTWNAGVGGSGSGGGVRVFFGTNDPSYTQTVNAGDIWVWG